MVGLNDAQAAPPRAVEADRGSISEEIFDVAGKRRRTDLPYGIHFATYGEEAYRESLGRIALEAEAIGLFHSITVFTKKERETVLDSRKPFCITEVMRRIQPGDVLVWADAGCVVYDTEAAYQQLAELCELVRHHATGVLRFDSTRAERAWTKRDVFDHVFPEAFLDQKATQLTGNRFLLCKGDSAADHVKEWANCVLRFSHLFDDSRSREVEAPEFKEHRHHHSVFSLISKRRGCALESTEALDVAIRAIRRKDLKQSVHAGDPAWTEKFLAKLRREETDLISAEVTYSAVVEAHASSEKAAAMGGQLLERHGQDALHQALTLKDNAAAAWLVTYADQSTLNFQNKHGGCTSLMRLAMGHCKNTTLNEALICRLLERGGVGAVVALRSKGGQTAADYAKANDRSEEVVAVLQTLEAEELQRTADQRCVVCSELISRRPWLEYFADRAERGEEDNASLKAFFDTGLHCKLLQSQYHQINDFRQIRKELSESLAILESLERALPAFDGSWHVVDLCSSKAVTAAVLMLRHPGVTVSAIDKLAPNNVPHFHKVGDCGMKYAQLDVLAEDFVPRLRELVEQAGRPAVLLGMHLCGWLSTRAVSAFEQLDMVQAVVLCPCCLPRKSDLSSPPHLYSSKDPLEQYQCWAGHLQSLLGEALQGSGQVTLDLAAEMLSPKNLVLTATRSGTSGSSVPRMI